MLHSVAAIQIPQIIISEDRDIDFIIPSSVNVSAVQSDDDDIDDDDDDGSSTTTPWRRQYLRPESIRCSRLRLSPLTLRLRHFSASLG